jgi:ferritin-like metal-binding protein YciE
VPAERFARCPMGDFDDNHTWNEVMSIKTPHELYVDTLKDLYSGENQLLRLLPRMAKVATTPELRQAITDNLHQAQVHLHRVDNILLRIGVGPKGNSFPAMEDLIVEARSKINGTAPGVSIDAALVDSLRRIQELELSVYGSANATAHELGFTSAANALQQSIDEKIAAGRELAEFAEVSR